MTSFEKPFELHGKTFDLVGVHSYLRGNEDWLIFGLPIIKTNNGKCFFATCSNWKGQDDFPTALYEINADEIAEAGIEIKPSKKIKELQIVAQAGPQFLSLIKGVASHEYEIFIRGSFDVTEGFRCKTLYPTEYKQFLCDVIDSACAVFDKEMERCRGQQLSDRAIKALRLFSSLVIEDKERLENMAIRLFSAAKIRPDEYYRDMAELYQEELGRDVVLTPPIKEKKVALAAFMAELSAFMAEKSPADIQRINSARESIAKSKAIANSL